nr:putative 15.0 kda protein in dhat-dhas intergenic region [Quercus suber]
MPNAKLTSIAIAIDKAFTAAGHRVPTATYTNSPAAKNFAPGGVAYGIHNSNGGRFTLIGGGVPIVVDGVVVGAIGVSTGTPAQDAEVAKAGVEAVEGFVKRRNGSKL